MAAAHAAARSGIRRRNEIQERKRERRKGEKRGYRRTRTKLIRSM